MLGLKRFLCSLLILATGVLSQSIAQTPELKPKPSGSISGRVTIGGKPAPEATVAAFTDNPNRRAAAQATTDSDGHYVLLGLGPAQYNVTVALPGFVGAGGSYYDAGKSVALALNETVDSVDFKLTRGGVITGRVTDADNRPVMEERVDLMEVDENGKPKNQQGRLFGNYQMYQTDDRGVYRLYGLPAGSYKVSIGTNPNSGFVTTGPRGYYRQTFHPDVNDPAKASIVEVSEGGETANIDIVVGRRASTYRVLGRVIDSETRDPISGVSVSYGPVQKDSTFFGGFVILPTNQQGEFRLEGLEPGRYGVSIASSYNSGTFYSDPTFFEIVDADLSDVEVKAVRGLSLSGVVVAEGITNKDALNLLPQLRIYASVPSSSSTVRTFSSGSSALGPDGSFQINGLRPGKASVYLSPGGNAALRPFSIVRLERDGVEQSQGFETGPGPVVSGLEVFITYGTGAIRGTVTITGGALPAEARLIVRAARPGVLNSGGSTQVDSRGHFLITGLAAGTYELLLQRYPMPPAQPGKRPPPLPKQTVSVADGAETEVAFLIDLSAEGGP